MEEKSNLYIVGIVGIIAVVALVVLVMSVGTTHEVAVSRTSASTDSAGQAIASVSGGGTVAKAPISLASQTNVKFSSFDYSGVSDPKTDALAYTPYLKMTCGSLQNAQIIGAFCSVTPYTAGDHIEVGTRVESKSADGKILSVACAGTAYNIQGKYQISGTVVCAYS